MLGLSACLSLKLVHCAETAEDIGTIFFACDSPLSVIDNGLHRSILSCSNFALKWLLI